MSESTKTVHRQPSTVSRFNLWKWETKLWLGGWYFTLFQRRFRSGGCEFIIPSELTTIPFRGQFAIDYYERQERENLKNYVHPDATVLELGGCLGIVSCLTNRILKNPKNHVVVEANPNVVPHLERNREHNHCQFSIENCMVSSQRVNEFFVGKSILASSPIRATTNLISVEGKTVEDLERQHGLKFDTLIMDIEGGELQFLRENRDWLRNLRTVFLEVHEHAEVLTAAEVEECRQILLGSGLKMALDDGNFWILIK